MADESQFSSGSDTTPTTNKRKYDDQVTTSTARRPTGFSSPDPAHAPPSYNNVPPPTDEIQLAKQRAQAIAARLLIGAGSDIKRPRVENGASGFDSNDKGFSSPPHDVKSLSNSAPSTIPVSYGSYQSGSSKKIEIPNGRVGVIIGKGGETIKYLQTRSGAKIQVTRDVDADLNSATRMVELMGTSEQIEKAEELINEVLAEAETGGSNTVSRRFTGQGQGQGDSDHFVIKIPNNKVGLVIGKGGDTIKQMQNRTGARIQVIPLHLPPGDTSSERNVHIEGTSEQIELAKQLVNEVISENRARNQSMSGGYPQQGYQTRPPTSWGQPGAPQMQQPSYGYVQPGSYPGASQQYNMSQPPYTGYPPQQSSGGYHSGWDQSNVSAGQQAGQGYDYYNQSASQLQTPGGTAPSADNSAYNYGQPPSSGYNQQGQGYDGYGGYAQSGYGQPPYDQQQGYASAPNYGSAANATQEGNTSYGTQGDMAQAPNQPPSMSQQGYLPSGQQPSPNPSNYPPQGTSQPGYGPTSQSGYGSQQPTQPAYGSNYGTQKPAGNPPTYGQTQQSPSTAGGYSQPAAVQPGYPHSQPPPSGYTQAESGQQRGPTGYGATGAQPGYGAPYGTAATGQSGYGAYNASYGGGYPQAGAAAYSADGNGSSNARASYEASPASQPAAQQSGVAKSSPQS